MTISNVPWHVTNKIPNVLGWDSALQTLYFVDIDPLQFTTPLQQFNQNTESRPLMKEIGLFSFKMIMVGFLASAQGFTPR